MRSMNSLRHSLRQARLHPGFSIVVILMLAVGIGTTTAVFSVAHSVLLRPLPVNDPEELVNLTSPGPRLFSGVSTGIAGGSETVFSYPMFRDLEDSQDVLSGIAAHRTFGMNFSSENQIVNDQGLLVSHDYFAVLGLSPEVGRLIDRRDEPSARESAVAVLSYSFWQNRFGGNRDVVGSTVTVNGTALTVIGVAPERFSGTTIGVDPAIYVPLTLAWVVQPGLGNDENYRGYHWLHVFGRLRDDVSISQAEASLSALYNSIINDVEAPMWTASDDALERFRNSSIYLEPGALGQSARRDGMRRPLAMLLGLSLLVLSIVCANIAGLSLARGATREGEIAVRVSIGATRWRLVQQLLTEMLVLAVVGGLLSLPVSVLTLQALATLLPPSQSGFVTGGIDTTAGLFAVVVTLVTMLIFGLAPALRRSRSSVALALSGTAARLSGGRERLVFWKSMATAQVALAVVLLVLSGLFIQSIRNIARVDIGMEIDSVVTFSVFPSLNGYSQDQIADFYRRLDEELSTEPGIQSVSSALVPLLSSSRFVRSLTMEGEEAGTDRDSFTDYNTVSEDFFSTFSLPIIAGRGFAASDVEGSAQVAIVNESFVRKYGLADPIGHRFGINEDEGIPEPRIEIIGIVPDAKYSEVKDDAPAQYYLPLGADSWPGFLRFYVQSGIQADTVMRSVRDVAARVDPNVPVMGLEPLTETVNRNVFEDRTITTVATAFAVIAVVLAAFGLHGVIAYSVSQRTRELGLRLALGSTSAGLRVLVLGQVGVIALVGGVVGLGAAVGLGRIAQSMLFGVSGFSLTAAAGAVIGLGIVVVAAGYVPAHRVMRIDPMSALRES